jgi:hypothetical protein
MKRGGIILKGNIENIPKINEDDVHLFFFCPQLSRLDGGGLIEQLNQIDTINGVSNAYKTPFLNGTQDKDFFVFSNSDTEELLTQINSIVDEPVENNNVRICEIRLKNTLFRGYDYTKEYIGFICPLDIVKKISVSMLKSLCEDITSTNIFDAIPKFNRETIFKIMEFIDKEQSLSSFEKRLFFTVQSISPQYYLNKLLISLFEHFAEQRKSSRETYHGKWFNLYDRYSDKKNAPDILAGAVALILEIKDARQLCSLGSTNELPDNFCFDRELTKNNSFNLCLLARIIDEEENSRYRNYESNILTALIQNFNNICAEHPESLVTALPWLIVLGKRSIDSLIISHAVNSTVIQNELNNLTKSSIPIIATRSNQILLTANGTDNVRAYEVISWWNDKLRGWKPDILDAPRSTWIGNANVENMLRDIGRKATNNLLDIDSLSEESLTGALLQSLVAEAKIFKNSIPNNTLLSLDYKKLSLPQEKECGADLMIVVQINYNGMETTRLHFVQIKRMNDGTDGYPKWTINLSQLEELMASESSATYWLFNDLPNAKVLCTPVGVIRACTSSRSSQGTTTISHSDVRNASIDLGNLLCDLVTGLWLGVEPDRTNAKFVNEKYKPKNILTIKISEMKNG